MSRGVKLVHQPKDSNPILTKPSDIATEYIRSLGDSISNVADKLEPLDPLISIFPSQPPIEHLHIIVKILPVGELLVVLSASSALLKPSSCGSRAEKENYTEGA